MGNLSDINKTLTEILKIIPHSCRMSLYLTIKQVTNIKIDGQIKVLIAF